MIQGKMDIDLSAQDNVEKLDKCVYELQKSIGKVHEDSEDGRRWRSSTWMRTKIVRST